MTCATNPVFESNHAGDQSVTVNPDEGLTAEEITVRNSNAFGESRLSPAMYQFLKKNHLLASSDKDVAYKYIKNGSIGRTIPGKKMQNELIVILDGSLRLVYGQNSAAGGVSGGSGSSTFGDIKCTQSGQKSAIFKVKSIIGHRILCGLILVYSVALCA